MQKVTRSGCALHVCVPQEAELLNMESDKEYDLVGGPGLCAVALMPEQHASHAPTWCTFLQSSISKCAARLYLNSQPALQDQAGASTLLALCTWGHVLTNDLPALPACMQVRQVLSYERDRVRFLLKAYLRARLEKVQRFAGK